MDEGPDCRAAPLVVSASDANISALFLDPVVAVSDREEAMLSHITIGTNDLARAGVFYDAVLICLGLVRREVIPDGGPPALCWFDPKTPFPRFYVYSPYDGGSATAGNGSMVAFLAPSPAAVAEAFARGIERGGTSEGEPGPRPHYGDDYFGAYLRDPDGNKLHIVYRGDIVGPIAS